MTVRKVVTQKHRTAAQLLLRGESGFQSLVKAGFSKWSARRFGEILRHSSALREAIRQEEQRQQHYLTIPPQRNKRDRRVIARNVRSYCLPEDSATITNTWIHKLHADEHKAKAIAKGEHTFRPFRCSLCHGPLERANRWCPRCLPVET